MHHHLVNLLALSVDMAAELGMGLDSRYGKLWQTLSGALVEAQYLADGQLTQDDIPGKEDEDYSEIYF